MRKQTPDLGRTVGLIVLALTAAACVPNGPVPEVVDQVEVDRYVGLWYEIASNPVFFNEDLVSVTAEYGIVAEDKISVLNRGRVGAPDGPEQSIAGQATVVDTQTNAKLAVSFFNNIFSFLFPGEYWIVLLDDENYEYAVVTDSMQFTLFVLYRQPSMPQALYDQILSELAAKQVNTTLLRVTGSVSP